MMTASVDLAPALALDRVGKSYRVDGKNLPVLEGISLDVRAGEFMAIVGASGCGKSTLLRLVAGLDAEFTGSINIGGRPVDGPGAERGVVFQDHRLFPWLSVFDNVALGLDNTSFDTQERKGRVQEVLSVVGLSSFAQAWPHQLSGGMAQRAAIARALVSEPGILLMDEPFGALDFLTRTHMQEELVRLWEARRVTVVIVTHDVDEAIFLGDTVVVMEPRPGRIRVVTPVELPRPRSRSSAAFGALKERVLAQLRR